MAGRFSLPNTLAIHGNKLFLKTALPSYYYKNCEIIILSSEFIC